MLVAHHEVRFQVVVGVVQVECESLPLWFVTDLRLEAFSRKRDGGRSACVCVCTSRRVVNCCRCDANRVPSRMTDV